MQCFELNPVSAGALCNLIILRNETFRLGCFCFNSKLTEKNHPTSACSMAESNPALNALNLAMSLGDQRDPGDI
uniref:Uncharacterized protein n=1 Tax=Moschus moschiferus TaxID=68415 RepID=A0A8C6ECM3_MOSMO